MNKVIFAERVFSEFKNAEVWRCSVKLENGKMYNRRDIVDADKAFRYMVMLARQEYIKIDPECKAMVNQARMEAKPEAAVPAAEEKKEAQKPTRRARSTKKNEKAA